MVSHSPHVPDGPALDADGPVLCQVMFWQSSVTHVMLRLSLIDETDRFRAL